MKRKSIPIFDRGQVGQAILLLGPAILTLLGLGGLSCTRSDKDTPLNLIPDDPFNRSIPILHVDGKPVTAGEIINAFALTGNFSILAHQAQTRNETSYLLNFSRNFVLERKIAEMARNAGLENSPEYRHRLARLTFDQMIQTFETKEVILKSGITEKDVRAYYDSLVRHERQNPELERNLRLISPRQIKFKYIFISERKWGAEEARKRAETVAEALKQGKNFQGLLHRYSDSEEPRELDRGWYKQGDLAAGGQGNPALEAAVFRLQRTGEHTPAVRTSNGYHFAMITGIREERVIPYEQVRMLIRDRYVVQEIQNRINTIIRDEGRKMRIQRRPELLDQLNAPGDEPIFQVEDFRYPLGLFRQVALEKNTVLRSEMETLLENEIRRAIIYQVAKQLGYGEIDPNLQGEAQSNRILRRLYIDRILAPSIEVPESRILAEFSSNPARYSHQTRLHVYNIWTQARFDTGAPRAVREKAMHEAEMRARHLFWNLLMDQGQPFTEVARTYSDDPVSAVRGGDMGHYGAQSRGRVFDQAAYSLAEGEISQPVRMNDGYAILWVRDKIPPRPKSFEEARPEILQDIHSRLLEDRLKEIETSLMADLQIEKNETSLATTSIYLLRANADALLQMALIR